MQSIRRQIKRGNAVMAYNTVSKGVEVVTKKHTESKQWNNAVKNRMEYSEQVYMDAVTMPSTHEQILNSKSMFIRNVPKKKRNDKQD